MEEFASRSSVAGSLIRRSGIANWKSRIGPDKDSMIMRPIPQENKENGSSMMESDDMMD